MARAKAAAPRLVAIMALTGLTMALGLGGNALAQTAAPIVYKSATPGAISAARLEPRADALSLNVAPHAPIPTFANFASFGPAPMASVPLPEATPLRTATVAAKPRAEQFVAPFAGPPYQVDGRWYVPAHEPNYDEIGIASWYGPAFHGKASASGEIFNENDLTAAHPTLPIPSLVKVTNLENGRSVIVRLNDRGPFVDDRIIDLSKAAAAALDMYAKGTARVRVQYVGPAPAEGGGAVSTTPAPQPVSLTAAPISPGRAPAAVTAPAAVRPPVQSTIAGERFFVQAGSFADLANAHKLRARLAPYGQVSVEAATVNGSEFYRVMVGPWSDRTRADAARQILASVGMDGLVVARGAGG